VLTMAVVLGFGLSALVRGLLPNHHFCGWHWDFVGLGRPILGVSDDSGFGRS